VLLERRKALPERVGAAIATAMNDSYLIGRALLWSGFTPLWRGEFATASERLERAYQLQLQHAPGRSCRRASSKRVAASATEAEACGFSTPHFAQRLAIAAPQLPQKRMPSGFSKPQLDQAKIRIVSQVSAQLCHTHGRK